MIQTGVAVWELFDKNYRYLGYKAIMSYFESPLPDRLKKLVAIHKQQNVGNGQLEKIVLTDFKKNGIAFHDLSSMHS
jgi:acyl-CoA-binding protein